MNIELSDKELALLFLHLPSVGPSSYWKFREHYSSYAHAILDSERDYRQLFCEAAREPLNDLAKNGRNSKIYQSLCVQQAQAEELGIQLICHSDSDYPGLLREIKRAPSLLFVKGNRGALNLPQIAIVGSRRPSAQGKGNALKFSRALSESGFVVTSGLALGVDALAHEGAIKAQGKTIGVLGCGLDKIYPASNRALSESLLETGGALVSEFLLGTSPKPQNFPQRNRIISGMSCGTLVVEAAVRSGSLITARYALQQNRDVFAIPGSIHNPLARGCHAMIKEGAVLVETAQDIVSELGSLLGFHQQSLDLNTNEHDSKIQAEEALSLNEDELEVIDAMGFDSIEFDSLALKTSFKSSDLMRILMNLEIKGLINDSGQGYMRV
ncbi:MAG: DNA processing protein [Flavobacteriales bacterium]|jgi:DNA processing protein